MTSGTILTDEQTLQATNIPEIQSALALIKKIEVAKGPDGNEHIFLYYDIGTGEEFSVIMIGRSEGKPVVSLGKFVISILAISARDQNKNLKSAGDLYRDLSVRVDPVAAQLQKIGIDKVDFGGVTVPTGELAKNLTMSIERNLNSPIKVLRPADR